MIRSLLVPLGADPSSREALAKAVELSQAHGAALHALHVDDRAKMRYVDMVMTGTQGPTPMEPLLEEDLEAADRSAEEERAAVRALYDAAEPSMRQAHSFSFREGDAAQAILEASRRVDLVVMGRKAAPHLPEALFTVVRHAEVPVLLVSGASTGAEGPVVLAYDGSRSAGKAMRAVGDLLIAAPRRIIVLTCCEKEEECLPLFEDAERYFKPYGLSVETRRHSCAPGEAILAAAGEAAASLIAMGGYGDNPVKEMLLGSTTEHVLLGAAVPVLTCSG